MPKDKQTYDGTVGDFEVISNPHEPNELLAREIEFIKGLETIIGETEGRPLVSSYSYGAVQNFIEFDTLGLLVCLNNSIEIYLCTGGSSVSQAKIDFMESTLADRLPISLREARQTRVIVLGELGDTPFDPAVCTSIVAPLLTHENVVGFAAILRDSVFAGHEERAFKRLCSHIALTLDKIYLFEQVTELAIKDGLTGIFNHLHIVSKLEWEIERSKRYGSNLSVIMFDIDDFKQINDRFGHLAGNQVLVGVAQLLKNSVRSSDAVGRYGGEEFLAVLPEAAGEAALIMAERLRSTIQDEDFVYEDQVIKLTVSGGVASYCDQIDANRLIRVADENLLDAKRLGKNVVIYD